MKRRWVVVSRVLPLLFLIAGVTILLIPRSMENAASDIDSRYLPSRASLQFHAERLANHFQHRLMTPPLNVLPDSLTQPVDSLLYPDFGLPPHLESADFPQRYPVSWTKSDGWIKPPPAAKEKSLIRMFNRMAKRTTWTAPTMIILFMDPPEKEGAMVLAGTWVYSSDNVGFEGVLTPVDAYYDFFLPRWFDEYCTITFGQILDSWVWRPTEFRLIPHDMERAPILFRESQALDSSTPFEDDIMNSYSSKAAALIQPLYGRIEINEGWRGTAEWFEASLYPLMDKIQVASPLKIDAYIANRSYNRIRWAIAMICLAIIMLPISWWKS